MMTSSMVRRLIKNAIRIPVAGAILAMLSIPAKAADNGARTSAEPRASEHERSATATSPGSVQPAAANDEVAPPRSASEPSLDQIMELLKDQSRELETLRSALREQQELTARLEAKLNSTGAGNVAVGSVAESVGAAQATSSSGAAQRDLAQKVAKLEAD